MLLRKFECGGHVGARRRTDQQAELAVKPFGHGYRIDARYFMCSIQSDAANQWRNEAACDALDPVAAGFFTGQQRGFGWFHGKDLRVGLAAFKPK